jgi:hypothetical protein
MASKEKSASQWPDVPASLQHDSFEMSEFDKQQPPLRPYADTAPEVTPYLGLRARLSQIWFNRWTVLLLLVLVRVLIALATLNEQIGDAKVKALSACTKVEDIGSAMASMPHYLSVGVNSLAADGISKSIHALVEVLMMILTGVEQLILFIINMYVGTYACLIAAFIHGGLDAAVGAVDGTVDAFNDNIGKITGEISSDIQSVQDLINKAFSTIKGIPGISVPKIDITSRLDDLKNIQIDDTKFIGGLQQLNTSIPTFDQVENFTKEAISIPFDLIRNKLNNSFASYEFDKTVFPVAEKQGLSFCSDNSFLNDFFQSLFELAAKAKIAFIVVITILAIGAIFLMAWLEIRRWRRQQRHAYVFSKHGYDPMDVVYIASRAFTATFGIKLASRFSGKRQLWARWAWAYATSLPALFVLSLAVAGFFSCMCQAILLRSLQKEAPALASQVGDFAGEVVGTLQNVSDNWARSANGVVTKFNTDINDELFGHVRNATAAVNNTLTTFEDEMNTAIDAVFKDTILYNTVKNVIRCLIGIKIDTVEAGLTWVHDHAHVNFPLFPNDTFSQGASDSIHGDSELTSFLATPASVTTDEISGAVDHVVKALRNSIIQEALISTMLLLVYVLIVLIGVLRAMAGMVGRDKTRGEGGQRYVTGTEAVDHEYTGEYRSAPSPRVTQRAGGKVDLMSGATRFPQFGAESAVSEDYEARRVRDEKLATYGGETTSKVRAGRPGVKGDGHWRKSSHGYVESADER